ncbi:MAG: hypothetical protein GY711_34975 [bacterium]|nr:hypothetical protein [bacterium]
MSPSPAEVELTRWLVQRGAYEVDGHFDHFLEVDVAFHIVRRTNGSGGLDAGALDGDLADLNDAFESTGIRFERGTSVRYIDSDAFYFEIDTQAEIDALRSTSPVAGMINVYFTPNLANENYSLCGISSFTFSAVQGIVMNNSCSSSFGNHATLVHEFGHYFDLFHTHETAFGVECPDGSNCGQAGDLVCSTPADPNLSGQVSQCQYTGNATACGFPYEPQPSNYMSYAPISCRVRFRGGQRTRMLATLIQLRPGLIGSPGLQVTWVDFAASGAQTGSFANPYRTLAAGIAATGAGGRVVVKGPATTTYAPTILAEVTLDAFRGEVVIGD